MPSEFDYSSLDFSKHLVGNSPTPDPSAPSESQAPSGLPSLPTRPAAPTASTHQEPRATSRPPVTAQEMEEYGEDQEDEEPAHRNVMASVLDGESSFALGYQGKATDHVRDGGEAFTHQDLFAGVAKKRKLVKTLKWTSGFTVLVAILAGSFIFLGQAAPEASRAATINDPLGSFSVIHTDAMQTFSDEVEPVDLSSETLKAGDALATSTGKNFSLASGSNAEIQATGCADLTFCLAGNYTAKDATGVAGDPHDVYYTQDVINAPAFAEASEFYRANLTANAEKNYAAGAITTVMFEGKPSRFLALLNGDGSAWLVRLYPDDKPQEIVKNF